MKDYLSLFCILFINLIASAETLMVYPVPDGIASNDSFSVKVRAAEGDWNDLFCYDVQVDMHQPRQASMAYFDFSGSVEISVTYNRGNVRSARIRPLSYGIKHKVIGNTISFILTRPRNLSIEVNGDIFHNLHLFAGKIEAEMPDPDDPDVIYFGPGVHKPGETYKVPSNTTVYIAGGAVVKSTLICDHVENVRIVGRGTIYQPDRGVQVTYSNNIEIDGIMVVNPRHYSVFVGQSQGITIRNVKSFSSKGWSDGIDMMSASDMLVDGVFMRNSDDCIAIYCHRWDYYGDSRNITVQNSTLWADVAHPVNMGTHGNPENPEVIENVTLKNIDILNHDEPQLNYQGCIAFTASDANLIKHIHIEDVRVEDFEQGQLLNLRVTHNKKYAKAAGRGIEDVLFKNVSYNGSNANMSIISGYDEHRIVRNVVFENLTINGKLIWDKMPGKPGYFLTSDMAHIFVGEHVEGLKFRKAENITKN